jgi:hypothetical protein
VLMGERCQRPVSGEAEMNNAVSGAWMRRRHYHGSTCVRDPRVEASGEAEAFRDPLYVRPWTKHRDGLVCSHVLLEAQQGEFSP